MSFYRHRARPSNSLAYAATRSIEDIYSIGPCRDI